MLKRAGSSKIAGARKKTLRQALKSAQSSGIFSPTEIIQQLLDKSFLRVQSVQQLDLIEPEPRRVKNQPIGYFSHFEFATGTRQQFANISNWRLASGADI